MTLQKTATSGSRRMTQWLEHLLHKCDGQGSAPRRSHESWACLSSSGLLHQGSEPCSRRAASVGSVRPSKPPGAKADHYHLIAADTSCLLASTARCKLCLQRHKGDTAEQLKELTPLASKWSQPHLKGSYPLSNPQERARADL